MKKYFTLAAGLLSATTLLLFSTVSSATDDIMITPDSAWTRATPPGSKTTAIYLSLMNHSDIAISLTAVSLSISDRVELHTHINDDGMMKMQQVSSIAIPAGGQASLKPHGDHIMVFNLQEQLIAGEEVSVELTFDNGDATTLIVPVRKEAPMSGESSMQEGMKHDEIHDSKKMKETDDAHQHDKAS